MENIKNIASDFLDDAIDAAKFDGRKFSDWRDFVQAAFSYSAANNVLDGYDNDEFAFNIISDNRFLVGEFLDSLGFVPPVNPFIEPARFLVFIVEAIAEDMEQDYVKEFAEIRE